MASGKENGVGKLRSCVFAGTRGLTANPAELASNRREITLFIHSAVHQLFKLEIISCQYLIVFLYCSSVAIWIGHDGVVQVGDLH